MKIIDNPTIGIGLLICVGLAVLGLTFLTPAEGQYQSTGFGLVTADEGTHSYVTFMHTDDSDDSPFIERPAQERTTREAVRTWTATQQLEPRQSSSRQGSVRVTTQLPDAPQRVEVQFVEDPFAPTTTRQRVVAQSRDLQYSRNDSREAQQRNAQQQAYNTVAAVRSEPAQPTLAEKRDELLFRIVQLRLQGGEYEKLAPVVMQMQNPEKAIEAMLDFAEESDGDNVSQLLDVATAATMQMGQPRPPMGMGMGMPGAVGMPSMGPTFVPDGVSSGTSTRQPSGGNNMMMYSVPPSAL